MRLAALAHHGGCFVFPVCLPHHPEGLDPAFASQEGARWVPSFRQERGSMMRGVARQLTAMEGSVMCMGGSRRQRPEDGVFITTYLQR